MFNEQIYENRRDNRVQMMFLAFKLSTFPSENRHLFPNPKSGLQNQESIPNPLQITG